MKPYKLLRRKFRYDIRKDDCVCILSGIPILDVKDLSLEHGVPLSRGPHYECTQDYNIFPAYKIINNLKGDLLPCEFWALREKIYKKALWQYKLTQHDKQVIQAALNFIPRYKINPCSMCFLYENCDESR